MLSHLDDHSALRFITDVPYCILVSCIRRWAGPPSLPGEISTFIYSYINDYFKHYHHVVSLLCLRHYTCQEIVSSGINQVTLSLTAVKQQPQLESWSQACN
ncbi:hypothetical protein PAMP_000764 [Pampus punctatissimus]